ncbi:MAG: helix-turn-helix transcriptional regulator [Clostridia bacterium]|nr:helix-turn-helix transcriptional regulator [Clostridia bacterium]
MKKNYIEMYKNLGLNIAYYRKKNGFSQIQFAEIIGISRTHMNRIENAECAVSLDVVFNICDSLSIPPSQLFDFRD